MTALAATAMGLNSCDSVKSKALGFLDEKIAQTTTEPNSTEAVEETTTETQAAPQRRMSEGVPIIQNISGDHLGLFTETQDHVVIVNYTSESCGSCRQMTPLLESLTNKADGKMLLANVDVQQNQILAQRVNVKRVPDVRIFVNGSQVDQITGRPKDEVLKKRIQTQLDKISSSGARAETEAPASAVQEAEQEVEQEVEEKKPVKPMSKEWLPPGVRRRGT